ncbi:uncharacterized protein LOC111593189 isoform X2 [Drosophila hydei]|uniref:Uncharacterized protein LOC111593189 isoform X2 n=1 Tax=Drosophila hydei TaxID=7224 RepID=A0A6J1LEA0_DROHY|nr:uncharacterized protein LOC111593189 isoform X2 [Drosophila hydei]
MEVSDDKVSVLDEQLFSSLKSSITKPNNNGQQMEVENLEIELKTPVENPADSYADPLQESTALPLNFSWRFSDEDILLNDNEQLPETVLLNPSKGRTKRGRPSSSNTRFHSSNGHIWNSERDMQTPLQEKLLVPKHQACGKGPAKLVSNAVESWMMLFDDEMLRMLLRLLNDQIRQRRSRNPPERFVDLVELRSWMGLSYLCGVFRNAQYNGPLEELWTLELGNAIFRATMSLTRFEFITNCLSHLGESSWNDALRLWQKLLINCRSYYGPSGWLCVDEQVLPDHLFLSLCCDAKTLFMTNAIINKTETKHSKDLIQLICDYKTTGRNITLGTRYASFSQCEQLLECNLSSLCTLPSTSLDYPKAWSGGALSNGAMKLTQHSGVALLVCGLNSQLNALQTHLHTSETCVEFHELANRYSTSLSMPARTKPDVFLQLLHLMLNVSAVNSWILLRLAPTGNSNIDQRDFQRQLGLFLTQQRLQRRLHRQSTATTLAMRLQICEILGQSSQRLLSEAAIEANQSNGVGVISLSHCMLPKGVALVSRYGDKHRRCKPCARNKREIKARSRCQQCQAHRCGNHLISRCYECMGLTTAQLPEGNIRDS